MSNDIKVLLVDDDARNIRILEEILEDDFSVESAASGEQALDRVVGFAPDIVLLDVMMPGIDGLEVTRRIRQLDDLRLIKIILVSGKARIEERLDGYAAGADDYVTKPFDHMELLAKVNVYAKLKTVEEVDRLKTDFLSLINHETGTPLNAIIGFSSLLLEEPSMRDEHRKMVARILEAGRYLHEKIDRLLLLSDLKKEDRCQKTRIQAGELVDSALQEVADAVRDRQITLEREVSPEFAFQGNYQLLQKALALILHNAVRFSPVGGTVVLRQLVSGDGRHCQFEVRDSGPGIDEGISEKLVGGFHVSSIDRHSNGLGISLALAKLISEMHGGSVTARNDENGGAVLTLSLATDTVS